MHSRRAFLASLAGVAAAHLPMPAESVADPGETEPNLEPIPGDVGDAPLQSTWRRWRTPPT